MGKNMIVLLMLFCFVGFTSANPDYSSWTSDGNGHLVSPDKMKYVKENKVYDNETNSLVSTTYSAEKDTFYAKFKSEFDTFKSTYESNMQDVSDVNANLADMNIEESEKQHVRDRITALRDKVANMYDQVMDKAKQVPVNAGMGNFNPLINSAVSMMDGYGKAGSPISYKSLYLEEAANLMEDYVSKSNAGHTNTLWVGSNNSANSEYTKFFNEVKKNYKNQLKYLNDPPTPPSFDARDRINPEQYLDKPLHNYTKKGLLLDFNWGGVSDLYKYYDQKQILLLFYDQFVSKSSSLNEDQKDDLERNLAWYLNVWPQASETLVMANNYDYNHPDYTEADLKGKQSGKYSNSMHLDEYGMLRDSKDFDEDSAGDDTTNYSKYYSDEVKSTDTFTKRTGSYNNRSYGYRYSNNSKSKTIKLTTGGVSYELEQNVYTSPIVLDMDGDGRIQASGGQWLPHKFNRTKLVQFDIDGDGFVDLTEWVGPQDGILLVYNGGEVNANNFFGNVGGFLDGYEKLSWLDKNKDRMITGEELSTLSIWMDKNGNAKIDAGEVKSVTEHNITRIRLTHKNLVSSFVQNGKNKRMWDWYPTYFAVKKKRQK